LPLLLPRSPESDFSLQVSAPVAGVQIHRATAAGRTEIAADAHAALLTRGLSQRAIDPAQSAADQRRTRANRTSISAIGSRRGGRNHSSDCTCHQNR